MSTKRLVVPAILATALFGCASTDPYTGSSRNEVISVQYGTLENVEQVAMSPSYGKDAAIGGGLGLLAGSSGSTATQVGAAAAGALIGAFVAKESAGTADRYTVSLVNGSTVVIVTEHHDLVAGDCVSIEQGRHANIRRVSPVMCSTPSSHPAYGAMHSATQQESAQCEAAKDDLLKATTEQQTDIGYRKMRALCES
jgi:outer membrane lipoprotein SlyB